MKRFTWWRMEQDAHHLSRALCGAFCSILHHVKRFISQPPHSVKNSEAKKLQDSYAGKFSQRLHDYTFKNEPIRQSYLHRVPLGPRGPADFFRTLYCSESEIDITIGFGYLDLVHFHTSHL